MARFHWYLPTAGDGPQIGAVTVVDPATTHTRPATVDYLAQVAPAAEAAGFASVLTPSGPACPDPWIVAAALAQRTDRLRFLVTVRSALPTVYFSGASEHAELVASRLADV